MEPPTPKPRGTKLTSSPSQPQQSPPQPPNLPPDKEKEDKPPPDMNKSNPRLLVNRESIYERQLPGDAYITVYVQRLQHGYYSSSEVSDPEAENVDFLALSFVFHSTQTLSHRFKSATIRASVQGPSQLANDTSSRSKSRIKNPRILMHAPHLIYGTVSPETMEWTFSLAGSIGISETPLSANLIPSGSVNSRYRRYEMMRIQGSARTLKSPRGPEFDVEAGEVVWSLEENNLQRSGLPREFTFVMLIQKPSATSDVKLALEIDPVVQSFWGSYPSWALNLPSYRPVKRRNVDFNREVGQRFEPINKERGFNFAALVSRFDDYIAMPGRKFSRRMEIPKETDLPDRQGYPPTYPGQYGSLNPMPGMPGTQGMQNGQGFQGLQANFKYQKETNTEPASFPAAPFLPTNTNMNMANINPPSNNLNVSLGPSHGVAIMNLSTLRSAMISPRARQPEEIKTKSRSRSRSKSRNRAGEMNDDTTLARTSSVNNDEMGSGPGTGEWPYSSEIGPGFEIETLRARMLRTVHWSSASENRGAEDDVEEGEGEGENRRKSRSNASIMKMENRPLTPSMILLGHSKEM